MVEYSNRNKERIKSISSRTRWNRRIHHVLSISIALLLLLSALTGILLAWKKNSDLIQPASNQGISTNMVDWLSSDKLADRAHLALDSLDIPAGEIDRMDFRPDKGIVKVLFKRGYWEVQLDCTSGSVLSVQKRYSDLIEKIHDGSIISNAFKLGAMNIFGIGLVILITTGFLLWIGPRKIRKIKSIRNPS
jgi:hypothetical protein